VNLQKIKKITKIPSNFSEGAPLFCVEITILADPRKIKKFYVVISLKG
jgi:hypothetical protein